MRNVSRLSLALIIVGSTLAITCATNTARIPNESVELAQIRRVEANFTRILDAGIRTQLAGGRSAIVVADEHATGNETGERDESGSPIILRHKIYRFDTGRELTVRELQRLRAGLQLRVDEAYAAGSLANFSDLSSLRVSGTAIEGTLSGGAIQ